MKPKYKRVLLKISGEALAGKNKTGLDLSLIHIWGTKIHPGTNVRIGSDDTLFAVADGVVRFERVGKDRKRVCVYAQ